LKGKWSIRQRHRFHSIPSVLSIILPVFAISQNWYNLSLIFTCTNGGEKIIRALKTPFLAIHAKGGESISPKQKDHTTERTTTPISKIFKTKLFSIGIFEISIPLRNSISIDIYILRRSFSKNGI
jgi:hypothetical protein